MTDITKYLHGHKWCGYLHCIVTWLWPWLCGIVTQCLMTLSSVSSNFKLLSSAVQLRSQPSTSLLTKGWTMVQVINPSWKYQSLRQMNIDFHGDLKAGKTIALGVTLKLSLLFPHLFPLPQIKYKKRILCQFLRFLCIGTPIGLAGPCPFPNKQRLQQRYIKSQADNASALPWRSPCGQSGSCQTFLGRRSTSKTARLMYKLVELRCRKVGGSYRIQLQRLSYAHDLPTLLGTRKWCETHWFPQSDIKFGNT